MFCINIPVGYIKVVVGSNDRIVNVQQNGIVGLNDLYELIAEYCQKSLHIYDKTALNEKDLSLLTRK